MRAEALVTAVWIATACTEPKKPPVSAPALTDAGQSGAGGAAGSASADCADAEGAEPRLALTEIANGFDRPLYVVSPPGDTTRLLVAEQAGRVHLIERGELLAAPFADLSDRVTRASNEQGLLGLAFHPKYAENGRVFIHYSTRGGAGTSEGDTVLSEFTRASESRLDETSEQVILTVEQPEANHNGGSVEFGKDGYLYLGLGDGGGARDRHGNIGNGQRLDTHLGKILRLDVDNPSGGRAYGIPPGNMTAPSLPENYSYGWRNPYRISFDACTGELYAGDVGQDLIEEISVEPFGAAGLNFGWRLLEGTRCFDPSSDCDPTGATVPPIAEYDHSFGCSVTGGYVYRGSLMPGLRGTYLYADFCSGRFWTLRWANGTASVAREITDEINPTGIVQISSFGQDARGEIYVTAFAGGAVLRVDPG